MNHRAKKYLPLLLAFALCLGLTGCWGSDPLEEENALGGLIGTGEAPSSEEDVVPITSFALPISDNASLDPITCGDGTDQMLLPLLYEGLFELDPSFAVQNVLCSEYSSSEDFTVWTFTLRSGVTFSDGTPLSAADVVDSLRRAKSSARYGARLSAVSSIRAEDGRVVVTLSRGNNRFPALLDIPITSSATAGDAVPAGTGPYVYTAGDSGAALTANSSWWRGETVPVETIPLRTVDEDATLAYLFSSHEIQMLVTDYTGSDSTSYKGNLMVTDAPTTTMQYLGFNCRSGLFSNAALRRAFSLGIYRESVCQAYFSGHAQSAQFPAAPDSPWYPEALEIPYSSETFQQAMEEAGYRTGSRRYNVEMLVCEGNSFRLSAANAIAASLSTCDVHVSVKTLPYAEYLSALQSGNFDLYYGEVRMTPDFDCSALLGTGGSLNYGGFSDPALDAQITTAFSTASSPSGANATMFETFQSLSPIAVVCFKTQSVVIQGGAVEQITPTYNNPFYQLSDWQIHLKGETTHG